LQYKPRESDESRTSQEQQESSASPDLDSTQLTTVNYDLGGSNESMNNNVDCCAADGADLGPRKAAPTIVPVLGPNG
jgi:hypothetical protein